MKYNLAYGTFHWLFHFFLASLLVWVTGFHLTNTIVTFDLLNFIIPIKLLHINTSYITQLNFGDLLIVYAITAIIDADHLKVYKRWGRKGLFRFAQSRITYPLHNFFSLSIFGILAAFSAVLFSRELAILLLVPVIHMLWDMFEDVFIFRSTYRKWEKTWGIGSKELEDMWKELEKIEKEMKQQDSLIRKQK
jgi:hypothetical protein